MGNVNTLRYGDDLKSILVPIASATVVSIGDLVKLSSGKAAQMATTTDAATFLGVALQASAAGEANPIVVAQDGVYEYPLDTATTVAVEDNVQWNAAQKVKKSDTHAIGRVQRAGTSLTSVLIRIKTAYTGETAS